MKTIVSLFLCLSIVFSQGIFAQTPIRNCHTSFGADTTQSCSSSLKVSFQEESVLLDGEKIVAWNWTFGDGAKSNSKKPVHRYTRPGKFTVALKIKTNYQNTYTSTIRNYIIVAGEMKVNLGKDTVLQPGESIVLDAGNPGAEYLWQDAASGRKYTVTKPGKYWVRVKKETCEAIDSINVSFANKGVTSTILADTTYACGSFLKVNFRDETILEPGDFIINWYWDFGDGGKSLDSRPFYLFQSPGHYTVQMVIKTHYGYTDTVIREKFIHVKGEVAVNLGKDTSVFEGTSIELDAGNPGGLYWWSTGERSQRIVAKAPGEYRVYVKKDGCEALGKINIDHVKKGVHSSIVADTTYACGTFLKVNFRDETKLEPGDFIINWYWDFGDGGQSLDSRPFYLFQKPGHYTVQMVIKTHYGYTDTVIREKFIHVKGEVVINLGKDTSVCEGTSIELDAGNPGGLYWWSTGERSQRIMTTTPGEYRVYVKKDGCEALGNIWIKERPPVYPQFGYSLNGNCLPVKASFTDSSSACGNNTILKYQWDFGDGSGSREQHPSHTYTSADTFIVRLTVWDVNGFSVSRSKRVVVQPNSGAAPTVNLGVDTSICESQPLVLNAGNPGASYLWSNGDTLSSCVVTETGAVWVRVEQKGCVAFDTVNVTVKPSLTPKFGYNILNNCQTTSVKFLDSSVTCGVQIVNWRWDFGDGNTSSERNPTNIYNQPGEYVVRMTIFDNIGNSFARSKLLVIPVGSNLVVNLGSDTSVCLGDPLTLQAGVSGASFLWNTGETSSSIEVWDAGEYNVRVEKDGCVGNDTIKVSTIYPIAPAFDYIVTNSCLPAAVKFEDKSIVRCSQKIVSWRWDFGDGTFSTEQHPKHVYTSADSFAVRLTVTTNNGFVIAKSRRVYIQNTAACQNLIQKQVLNIEKAATWFKEVKVRISPNPSHGIVYIQLSKIPEKAVAITVIDRFGQRVFTKYSSDQTTVLNLGNLAKGYYTVELSTGSQRKTIPIIIQ